MKKGTGPAIVHRDGRSRKARIVKKNLERTRILPPSGRKAEVIEIAKLASAKVSDSKMAHLKHDCAMTPWVHDRGYNPDFPRFKAMNFLRS